MSPKDADGMTNSVDPDQTAPRSGLGLLFCVQGYLAEKLSIIMVITICVQSCLAKKLSMIMVI